MTVADFSPLLPDIVLLVGAVWLVVLDLLLPHGDKRLMAGGAIVALAAAAYATWAFDTDGAAWGGAYVGTPLATFLKRLFYAGGAVAILGARTHVHQRYTRRQSEYYLPLLFSVLGMSLLAGTRDLILLAVAFELMGIPLYVLAAFGRDDKRAIEGAIKFYLVGAASTAVLLFGVSLLFGLAHDTSIPNVIGHVVAHPSPLALIGVALVLAGLGFKIGIFPFHSWVPDAYEGGHTPFVAFLAAMPKIGGFTVFVQLLLPQQAALARYSFGPLMALSITTLVIGNLLALRQPNVKRLLAFSGVGHVGFLMLAIATCSETGLGMLLFYAVAYVFTNMGAFLVVHAVRQGSGGDDSITSFDGLVRRNGWLATAMLTFLLSLAGIPFVVGFWAKLFVFVAIWEAGFYGVVVFGAAISVLALFYYLRVARAAFMNPPATAARIEVDPVTNAAILVCVAVVVGVGLVPGPLYEAAKAAATGYLGG